jgi:hypothetical protein
MKMKTIIKMETLSYTITRKDDGSCTFVVYRGEGDDETIVSGNASSEIAARKQVAQALVDSVHAR